MNLLSGLLASGIVGSITFIALLIIRPISEKFFSKTWHYYSLLVPIAFMLGGTLLAGELAGELAYVSFESEQAAHQFVVPQNPVFVEPVFLNEPSIEVVSSTTSRAFTIQPLLEYTARLAPYILLIWMLGVVVFVGINLTKYLKYRHLLLSNTQTNAQSFVDAECKIPIVTSLAAHTPMLLGIIKPVIVLPNIQLEAKELDMVLSHEMMHHKRKDLLFKLLGFVANAVHWHNPLVYILNNQLNILCELSCDEKLAAEMDAHERKFYGETILQILQHGANLKFSAKLAGSFMLATNLCNSKKNIKRRLNNMMNSKKIKKPAIIFSVLVGIFVIGMGLVMSHWVDSAIPVHASPVHAGEVIRLGAEDYYYNLNAENDYAVDVAVDATVTPPLINQFAWPVPSHTRISSTFGIRINPIDAREEFHTGIDIPAPTGADIIAAYDGVVTFSGWLEGFGNTVIIYHGDGISTLYAQNMSNLVSVNDNVVRGQLIATVGSTGESTGPHLHFEVRRNDEPIDPNLTVFN